MRIGFLLPGFPAQTHIWMWREISFFDGAGDEVSLVSSRRPDPAIRARHAFATPAIARTAYLWPPTLKTMAAVGGQAALRPLRLMSGVAAVMRASEEIPIRARVGSIFSGVLLARLVERRSLEWLHVHSAGSCALMAMMASAITGVPYSVVVNADLHEWGGGLSEKFDRAELVVTHASWIAAKIDAELPREAGGKTLCASVGVDTDRWTPAATRSSDASPFRLLAVGRLNFVKGFDDLVEAVRLLHGRGVPLEATIVGEGPYRKDLERRIAEAGLGAVVRLAGTMGEDEIIREGHGSDLFVLSSHREPLGVVLMEAMAIGLPIVATSAGGVTEIIDDGETGVLVAPREPAQLAEAIESLLRDPERRRRLGTAARESVRARFDHRLGAARLREAILCRIQQPDGDLRASGAHHRRAAQAVHTRGPR